MSASTRRNDSEAEQRARETPRDWIRLSIDAYRHPKVIGLTDPQFRAWVALLSEGKRTSPEGTWRSPAHLRACIPLYARHVPALIRAGLLDGVLDGGLSIHEWSRWQDDKHARYRREHREEINDRKRQKYAAERDPNTDGTTSGRPSGDPGATPDGDLDGDGDVTTTTASSANDVAPSVVVAYEALYGSPVNDRKRAFLVNIEERWGRDRAIHALHGEHRTDPSPRTICGRMERGLREGDLLARLELIDAAGGANP